MADAEGNVTIEISSRGTCIRCKSCGAELSYGVEDASDDDSGADSGKLGVSKGDAGAAGDKSDVSVGGVVGGIIVLLIIIYLVLIACEVVPSPFQP